MPEHPWLRDLRERQRNIVFPDTVLNEARMFRNILAPGTALNPIQGLGTGLVGVTLLGGSAIMLAFGIADFISGDAIAAGAIMLLACAIPLLLFYLGFRLVIRSVLPNPSPSEPSTSTSTRFTNSVRRPFSAKRRPRRKQQPGGETGI